MTTPLRFRCTACGACCRALRVAVTALDVRRLAQVSGRPPRELVAWLAPDAVDMSGETQSFVELSEGRRLMVLAQRDEACVLLGADNRCRAYAARPRDCRTFPFDFARGPSSGAASDTERLTLLPLVGCEAADDGANDVSTLAREDADRWQELEGYRALVSRWNRGVFHRRRLGRSAGDAEAFLSFALGASDAAP